MIVGIAPTSPIEIILTLLLSIFFGAGGIGHFTKTDFFISIMPPGIPWPFFWVYFTGVCEIVGAIGLWITPIRPFAAWGLLILCIGVFPANIYMAYCPERFPQFSTMALYARLPCQFILIYMCYLLTRY